MTDDLSDSTYVIRTGSAATNRLELLARLFWPTTEVFLERTSAFEANRFLDVGCGIGDVACRAATAGVELTTGLDANIPVIEAAKERCRHVGSPVSFKVGTLADLGTKPELEDFDVVYTRCLVSHTGNPHEALEHMVRAAKSGGLLLIEDVQVSAVWSSPPSRALERHVQLYVEAAHGLGASPEVAPEIGTILRTLGASEVSVDVTQPLLRNSADLQIHARTMEAIEAPVVELGLATKGEVAELIAKLDELATTPEFVATLPRIVQVSARAP